MTVRGAPRICQQLLDKRPRQACSSAAGGRVAARRPGWAAGQPCEVVGVKLGRPITERAHSADNEFLIAADIR
jgi:hypothetical protein